MSETSPGAWYAPGCPEWCEHNHACVLTAATDPTTDAADWAASSVYHSRRLAEARDGFSVELSQLETHPEEEPHGSDPALFVFLPDHHDANGTTADALRIWAQLLNAAADLADELTHGGRA